MSIKKFISTNDLNLLKSNIRWLHNGKSIDLGHRYSLNHNTGVLVISNVRLDDNGVWQCANEKQLARAINLVVLGTCTRSHDNDRC